MKTKQYAKVIAQLRAVGVRPTRQRPALAKLLFDGDKRHVTAESLHVEVSKTSIKVSLATVYNTLHQFTNAGLLRDVVVDPNRRYFDTNISEHHHFYFEDSNQLADISVDDIAVTKLPKIPPSKNVRRIDVVVRVSG